ncbi:MAG TPA: homocysteine S-methyltransferase family protein [Gaiellaceae bacterium]|nr:homocysteine S-methyltransferase family protein [Gaiellaceae bacterium]
MTLPQLSDAVFITDGGLETTLIFRDGFDLPHFAAFDLLKDDVGRAGLRAYYEQYIRVAKEQGVGAVLDTPTWRANGDWGAVVGYSAEELDDVNRSAVELVDGLRDGDSTILVSGCVGPRRDGYQAVDLMTAEEAERYHTRQVATFAGTAADLVSALTMTYADEAIGVARAAAATGVPVAVSFTVETDGRLPSGQPLREAVEQTDAETGGSVGYFMVNCAHPTHFDGVLAGDAPRVARVRGLRPNASTRSHAELDEAEDLDAGDPVDLGARLGELRRRLPALNVVGGCCGTDERHVGEMCRAVLAARSA